MEPNLLRGIGTHPTANALAYAVTKEQSTLAQYLLGESVATAAVTG
jgi:hypothetical protein